MAMIPFRYPHHTQALISPSAARTHRESPPQLRAVHLAPDPFFFLVALPAPGATRSIEMGASATLRKLVAHDPVLTACAVLSAIGIGAPLIVPPIRNALNRPEPIAPPKLSHVVEGMTGKSRN